MACNRSGWSSARLANLPRHSSMISTSICSVSGNRCCLRSAFARKYFPRRTPTLSASKFLSAISIPSRRMPSASSCSPKVILILPRPGSNRSIRLSSHWFEPWRQGLMRYGLLISRIDQVRITLVRIDPFNPFNPFCGKPRKSAIIPD
jgi:hypothetical protein